MKMRLLVIALCGCALATGCASNPRTAESAPATTAAIDRNKEFPTADSIFREGDVKKNAPTIYQHTIEEVRPAVARSLTAVGCKLDKQEDFFVRGKRPHKMGLFVGSGGETVKVFMYPKGPGETHVWVDTDLSFVGLAGQQGWNKQVLAELSRILDSTQASAK